MSCRIVAATNQALTERVEAGLFRRDLFHRLAGIEIALPPLRERGDDCLLIAQAMLRRLPDRQRGLGFTPAALRALRVHHFAGNVRELSHRVRRGAQRAGTGWITPEHLGLPAEGAVSAGSIMPTPAQTWSTADEGAVLSTRGPQALGSSIRSLCAYGVPRREVAHRLGVSERTVYRHLARSSGEA